MGDKTRDIENKSIYFHEVLGFIPFCSKAVTMTGLTAVDARQLAEEGTFGRGTFITNYDTMLESWSKGITTQVEFRREWNDLMEGILGSGEDRIAALNLPRFARNPNVPFITKDKQKLGSVRQIRMTKNGYYVSTNLNNRDKMRILNRIFKSLGMNASCTVVEEMQDILF